MKKIQMTVQMRMRIEETYGAPKTEALEQSVRISREMMHAHCLKTGR